MHGLYIPDDMDSSQTGILTLATGLDPAQEYTVVVGRCNEASYGVTTLRSVNVGHGVVALDPPPLAVRRPCAHQICM